LPRPRALLVGCFGSGYCASPGGKKKHVSLRIACVRLFGRVGGTVASLVWKQDQAHNTLTNTNSRYPNYQRRNIRHITLFLDSALYLLTCSSELTINITRKVLLLIETNSNPSSANSNVLSDSTYIEKGTLEPDNPEMRLN
jgi:hypothetical protein